MYRLYRGRRQIETDFKVLMSSRFHIKDTYLTDLNRIEKLFSIVMVTFARAYVVDVFADQNIKSIRILKHGRKAKSLFKYGLEFIAASLLNPLDSNKFDSFCFFMYLKLSQKTM